MPPLIWEHRPDGLRAPALVCAFPGWNDAGDAASAALQFLRSSRCATRLPRVPRPPRDLVLLQGAEPSMRWRSFSRLIVDLAEALGTQMVVTMGALLADVPHSRPVPITGLSSDEGLVQRVGLSPSSYEGPTGIVGVLHSACQEAGVPTASLWASVPHYVAAAPNPKAALALARKLEGLVE